MCSNTQTFKYILKRIKIDESNINRCLTVVFMNENSDHVRMFLKQIPEKLMKKKLSPMFSCSDALLFHRLGKRNMAEIQGKHLEVFAYKQGAEVLNTVDDEVINDFPINTPKRLVIPSGKTEC